MGRERYWCAMLDSLFSDGGIWFSIPAIIGTIYFLIQIFMGGIGGDLDIDVDLEGAGDVGLGDAPGAEFGVLSAQTLSAFFMGSGWMGFAALRLLDFGFTGAVLIAIGAGVFFAWLIIKVMRTMMKLQNSGNVAIRDTVGLSGDVYVQVPPEGQGMGRVKVVLGSRQREFNCVQIGSDPIPSRTSVQVTDANATTNTLTVERSS